MSAAQRQGVHFIEKNTATQTQTSYKEGVLVENIDLQYFARVMQTSSAKRHWMESLTRFKSHRKEDKFIRRKSLNLSEVKWPSGHLHSFKSAKQMQRFLQLASMSQDWAAHLFP